jgi:hypothetical protein
LILEKNNDMKKPNLTLLIALFISLAYGQKQSDDWLSKDLDEGKITVKYRISEHTDSVGDKFIQIEDYATLTDSISYQKCISLMQDIERHNEFTGDHMSKKVKTITDNECIIYYYSKNPWPIANSDCVAKMVFSEDTVNHIAKFIIVATPDAYDLKDVNRMINFKVEYVFEDLGNGLVKIKVEGKSSPPVNVPLWVIKSAFPELPAKALKKIVNITKY